MQSQWMVVWMLAECPLGQSLHCLPVLAYAQYISLGYVSPPIVTTDSAAQKTVNGPRTSNMPDLSELGTEVDVETELLSRPPAPKGREGLPSGVPGSGKVWNVWRHSKVLHIIFYATVGCVHTYYMYQICFCTYYLQECLGHFYCTLATIPIVALLAVDQQFLTYNGLIVYYSIT